MLGDEGLVQQPALDDALAERLDEWFVVDGLTAVQVLDGAAVIATDFRIDAVGWMRFAVFAREGVGPGRLGRVVQRLTELETYRAMAMLGFPRARSLSATLNSASPAASCCSPISVPCKAATCSAPICASAPTTPDGAAASPEPDRCLAKRQDRPPQK